LNFALANGTKVMRVFVVSCLAATIIALVAGAILVELVQESSAAAFTEPSARIN
jgi:hypothetical protein